METSWTESLIINAARKYSMLSAQDMANAIGNDIENLIDGGIKDDLSIVCIKKK